MISEALVIKAMPFFALSLSLATKSSLPLGSAALFLSASCLPGSLYLASFLVGYTSLHTMVFVVI